jgi:hypothetical protein
MRRVTRMFASRNGELIRELVADSQGDPALARDFRNRFFAHRRAAAAVTIETGRPGGRGWRAEVRRLFEAHEAKRGLAMITTDLADAGRRVSKNTSPR